MAVVNVLYLTVWTLFTACIFQSVSCQNGSSTDPMGSSLTIDHKTTTKTTTLPPLKDQSKPTTDNGVTSTAAATAKPTAAKKMCYSHVGCFYNAPPFDNAASLLPRSPQDIGTQFLLYTRSNWNETFFVDYANISSIPNSNFNKSLPTKFIIHGFSNTINTTWLYTMKDELLKKDLMNVVIVVWGPGAWGSDGTLPNYDQAVANTRVVAMQIFILIKNMADLGASYSDIHLIGHSLGAHTSGYVGNYLKKENKTIARITGLDPAEPDFKDHPITVRLDKDDADFVDVIHTNGAPFSQEFGAGMIDECGDVDFYVNGGETQPDCPDLIQGLLDYLSGKISNVADVASCSHSRSHDVFTESINSLCPFTAFPCDNFKTFNNGDCLTCGEQGICGTMGYYAEYAATGTFYFKTRLSTPFCGHHYAVRVDVSAQAVDTAGSIQVQVNGTWGVSEWLDVTRSSSDSIRKGSSQNRLVITDGIVGMIESINVQYTKASGTLAFGKGRGSLVLRQVAVVDGENGDKYVFCADKPVASGKTATFQAAKSCSNV